MKDRSVHAVAAALAVALVPLAAAQTLHPTPSLLSGVQGVASDGPLRASGPHDFTKSPMAQPEHRMMLESESALLRPARVPDGGYANVEPGVGIGQGVSDNDGDDWSRFIDQPLECVTGWFSNNNSDINPYLRFEDFVADGSPLSDVTFYGGVYDFNTGTDGGLDKVATYGLEIWTINQGGGDCGWEYGSFVGGQIFTPAELSPTFVCDTGGFFDAYEYTATFAADIPLNAGQNYMITIYASVVDPAGSQVWAWNQSSAANFNPATSWSLVDGLYYFCGPDMAFATNTASGGSCQEHDCDTTCYFSNANSNADPFLSFDDFTASATADLSRLSFTGGGWDIGSASPSTLANVSGFEIELYTSVADNNMPCGNWITTYHGETFVNMADANPVFDCIDIHGIPQYRFTVDIPAGLLPLTAGEHYLVGVFAHAIDPDDTRIFCWGGTSGIVDFQSWSFNRTTGQQEVCHVVDQAFCVNPEFPCLGDYNGDGTVNTLDVLAFLNDWAAGLPGADCNADGIVNTLDVLCYLNRYAAGGC